MPYSVTLNKRAEKDLQAILKSVSPAMRRNLLAAIERLQENPYPRQSPGAGQDVIKRLQNVPKGGNGNWRIECGDYRIRYDIDETHVDITHVAHRREVYRDV